MFMSLYFFFSKKGRRRWEVFSKKADPLLNKKTTRHIYLHNRHIICTLALKPIRVRVKFIAPL